MDTNTVEVRKNVAVYSHFANIQANTAYSVTKYINVEFIPDEVVVRAIYFSSENGEIKGVRGTMLQSSFCPDFLIPIQDSVVVGTYKIYFKITQPISGYYTFNFYNIQGGVNIGAKGDTDFSMVLEFIKYKSVNPQKIY